MPTVLPSRIEAVSVHRDGALITRIADLSGVEGAYPSLVRLGDLPLALDDGSVRAEVRAEQGAPPQAVEVALSLSPPEADETRTPATDVALLAARHALALAEEEVARLETTLERLKELAPVARPQPAEGEPPAPAPVSERLELLAFRSAQARRVLGSLQEARAVRSDAKRDLDREQARHERQTSDRQAREHELRKAATVRLHGGDGGQATLVIHYTVPGACWVPSYALRLEPTLDRAWLEVRAMVAQRSGEDWAGVRLTLCTAALQAWTELPELRALRIGRAQDSPTRRGFRAAPQGALALLGDYEAAFESHGAVALEPMPSQEPPPEPEPSVGDIEVEITMALSMEDAELEDNARRRRGQGAPRTMHKRGPPPAPAAPPMPAPAPPMRGAQMMSAKKGGIFAGLGASRAAASGSFEEEEQAVDFDGWDEQTPDVVEPALAIGDALLDYGTLRLQGARASDRLRLTPASRQDLLLGPRAAADLARSERWLAQASRTRHKAMSVSEQPPPARHVRVTSQDGFDFAWTADHTLNLPSDGAFHGVEVTRRDGPCRAHHICVPREGAEVFRQVRMDNPLQAPLLPGPMDVFVGESWRVTADVAATPVGGAMEVGLGVEQAIKVARNVRYREEVAGLLSPVQVLTTEVEVQVDNRLATPALVEVRERLPVVREGEDEIEIAEREVRPTWERWEQPESDLLGGRCWQVRLAPGERQTLQATWVVQIPKNHELVGGNRREG